MAIILVLERAVSSLPFTWRYISPSWPSLTVQAHEWLAAGRPGPAVRSYLTEPTLRRLARIQLEDDDGAIL